MTEYAANQDSYTNTGKVAKIFGEYGFVTCEDYEKQLYFKTSWFRGSPPLQEGDTVTFEVKTFEDNLQAHHLSRTAVQQTNQRAQLLPTSDRTRLFDWAYLGHLPNTLYELKELALKERWEFKNAPRDPDKPYPILYGYLAYTFGRLALERKILVNEKGTLAAFNTGLVDHRYEPIHALFVPNDDPRAPWQLQSFCIPGEGSDGQNLVRNFSPLPEAAHYFDDPVDLLYDTRSIGKKPALDWHHIIIERIDRYPQEFIEEHWPSGFEKKDIEQLSDAERREYFHDLGNTIEADNRLYRRIMNRMLDAVDLSIKRVTWNFKTAVPQYYPRIKKLQLLLPLCLVDDEVVDLALAVEKTPSGSYLGHTVLSLDWAYRNARLVCRPDSDWLAPEDIIQSYVDND